MDSRLKLIKLLEEAKQIAWDNIENAHNIDLHNISEQLTDYIFDLEQISQFETYPDEHDETHFEGNEEELD